jgi:drug/metabolite transporter (DMT)-like permease
MEDQASSAPAPLPATIRTEDVSWTRRQAALAVLVGSLCFATSGPLARVAEPAHPLVIAAGRTGLAAVLLVLFTSRATLHAIRSTPPRTLLAVAGAGLLLAAHFAFFLAGLAATSLSAAVTLVSLEPVAVVLTAWIAFRARPRVGEAIGIVLATLGALAVATGAGAGGHRLLGDLLVIVAVALYGLYIGAAKGLSRALPPAAYVTLVYASAGIALTLAAFAVGAPFPTQTRSLLSITALAVIPTLGGHSLVQWSARHVRPSVVALVSPGETLGSLLIAAVLLSEPPTVPELVGAALVLSGVGVTLAAERPQR